MDQALPSGGVFWRMLGAWSDLRGSMRAELDRPPSEGRLLYFVMVANLFRFAGAAMALGFGPLAMTIPEDELTARIAAAFVVNILFLTLLFYAMAATGGALARSMGGTGTWYDCRAALFWAALVAAPAVLGAKLLSLVMAGWPDAVVGGVEMLGGLAFAWTTAHCFAEANGFSSVWRVLAVLAAVVLSVVGVLYLAANV